MTLTIFALIILLFSIIIHEVAHGGVAYYLGDPTAKYAGRLTLNPFKHLDLFGSVIVPFSLFLIYSLSGVMGPIVGWAKPVPINPNNFRDKKWGELKVSIAGPATNFLIAAGFGLTIRFITLPQILFSLFSIIVLYNFLWGLFNLVPIPPLDGSHILFSLLPYKYKKFQFSLQQYGLFILIFFIFFGGLELIFSGAIWLYYLTVGQSVLTLL